MTFVIVTHVQHVYYNDQFFGYAPYIREMNLWIKYVTKVIVVAPIKKEIPNKIEIAYEHDNIKFISVSDFNIKSFSAAIKIVFKLPNILFEIANSCSKATHIHLRCPGNMGLLGSIVQILFPNKIKTAKYAGNWDPKANNPMSYKLQKWILSNTFLTKNMKILVYGEWQNQSKNIKPFFTATYKESDKVSVEIKNLENEISFMFVGMLTKGKNPLYAIQLIEKLQIKNQKISLSIFGDGIEKQFLENYIKTNKLEHFVFLKGNQNLETLKNAYQNSHFMILPSESEGWPKAVAEAMFWGCLPISTAVSCVANMLDNGNRGILIDLNLENDYQKIEEVLNNENLYAIKSKNAIDWSRKYTLDLFEQEISLLLH